MLNLVLFGPPGAGKGTQAELLQKKYGLLHLSTGEAIRSQIAAGSELGLAAQKQMEGGGLASDELVCGIVADFVAQNTKANGVIFDGFPRTTVQAQTFDKIMTEKGLHVTAMVAMDIPDAEIIERITKRALISGRADDQDPKIIQNRIDTYNAQTAVVADFYKAQGKYTAIDGRGTIEQIFDKLCAVIDKLKS